MKNFYKYLTYIFIALSILFLIGIIAELTSNQNNVNGSNNDLEKGVLENQETALNNQDENIQNQQELVEVLMKTSMGDITIELDTINAPITTENFLSYVREGYYENLVFHRVISDFMIQGGGFDQQEVQKETKSPIILESFNGLSNTRGTIAMARTNVPNSATSQFFINVVDNNFLDYTGPTNPGYAVFGRVTEGMDIVDRIREVETTTKGPHQNWPVENIIINSIEIIN